MIKVQMGDSFEGYEEAGRDKDEAWRTARKAKYAIKLRDSYGLKESIS